MVDTRKANQVWTPNPPPHKPVPPTDIKVNGVDEAAEMSTKSMGTVKIKAKIDDAKADHTVKLKVQYSSNNFVGGDTKTLRTDMGKAPRHEVIELTGLAINTLYKARLWTIDNNDKVSNENTISFWTNRAPVVELVDPAENSEYGEDQIILFDWRLNDPDSPDKQDQKQWQLKYQPAYRGSSAGAAGAWQYLPAGGDHIQGGEEGKNTYVSIPAANLTANTTYYWTVRASDPQGVWSDWAPTQSFFVRGVSSPPILLAPVGGIGTAVIAAGTIRFSWRFRDPSPSSKQVQADLRYQVSAVGGLPPGQEGWVTLFGQGVTPGETMQWDVPGGNFQPGFIYEWQVRTYEDGAPGLPSGWSDSGFFVATVVPGSANTAPPLEEESDPLGELGCGHHRVFVYDRGGRVLRGEIKPLQRVQWGRKRDDIANCLINTNGFDQDCCELLGNLTSWAHEIVIFRDGIRVFEGPITRITYTSESVEVEAKDVMGYLYRRVMRQGYNDAYRRVDLTPKTPPQPVGIPGGGPYTIVGEVSVVDRAMQIALNALGYLDPNVLPYLTPIRYSNDATQQRTVPDYAKTAWEEIDDLAATAGLDYTTIGRRIVFWDTHRMLGRLPEMRDGDFSDPVIVTEYGMQTANWYAVTNNNGVAGYVYPLGHTDGNWYEMYGPVEMVSSAYGEQEGTTESTEALSPADLAKLQDNLRDQARRGIASRWPNPVVVRVPDNTTINPQVNLGINQLVPGVWIPLRATLTCRKLSQWQKLDSVDVEEIEGVESVRVTMSPAPHGGDDDPDLAAAADAS